jgi:hypothetical protein
MELRQNNSLLHSLSQILLPVYQNNSIVQNSNLEKLRRTSATFFRLNLIGYAHESQYTPTRLWQKNIFGCCPPSPPPPKSCHQKCRSLGSIQTRRTDCKLPSDLQLMYDPSQLMQLHSNSSSISPNYVCVKSKLSFANWLRGIYLNEICSRFEPERPVRISKCCHAFFKTSCVSV